MLCTPILSEDYEAVDEANKRADLIELRLDLFEPKDLKSLRRACSKPVIFTLKEPSKKKLSLQPEYIDLPHSIEFEHPGRIVSFHDFDETPDLDDLFARMQQQKGIYKIATKANSTCDALRMLQFVKKTGILGICMGELGRITRILAPVFNVPWTYAPISKEHQSAPGQLLLKELVETYRFRSLSSKSAIYGLIGDPVSASPSHRTHNFAFSQLGLDAVYVKMEVKQDELSACFSLCREIFHGLSVTMPHKRRVVELLDQPCEETINTVAFRKGKAHGCNTDGKGALDAIEKRGVVKGKRIAILGAGGAALAIAKEAEERGGIVNILYRTEKLPVYDILINCTPTCPISTEHLLKHRLVMEIRHGETPLLIAAKERGCETIDGMEMFIQQAIGQFAYWYDVAD